MHQHDPTPVVLYQYALLLVQGTAAKHHSILKCVTISFFERKKKLFIEVVRYAIF